jgi:hypothetical protein
MVAAEEATIEDLQKNRNGFFSTRGTMEMLLKRVDA